MKGTEGTPYALEAEQAVVSALFGAKARDLFDRLVLVVKEEDFFIRAHAIVFKAFAQMVEEGATPDQATLVSRIKSSFTIDKETSSVLAEAYTYPYSPENIESYGRLIADKAVARRLASRLSEIQGKTGLVGGELSADDLLRELDAVAQGELRGAQQNEILQDLNVALTNTITWMERRNDGEISGIEIGIKSVDEFLGGLEETDLMIVAGRPSMGKTALALSIARNLADAEDKPLVPIFSLEMGERQLMFRFLANYGSINHDHLRRAQLSDDEFVALSAAIGRFSQTNIRIDCGAELSPAIMKAKLRLLMNQNRSRRLGGIFVDYLQLMQPDRLLQNKATEVAEISRAMKLIAKEFKAPVFALSQLNRDVEKRPNKRPVMADLRESGGIEQDADVIAMLYRDEYYNPDTDQKGITEIIIPKNRNGQVGTVPAAFFGEYQRFTDAQFGRYFEE